MGFNHKVGTAVFSTCQIHFKHAEEYYARPDNCFRLLSEGPMSHGGCKNGDTFGPPTHEAVPVLAKSPGILSKGQSPEVDRGYVRRALSIRLWFLTICSTLDINNKRVPAG